jgi:hypothetical protein
MFARDAVDPPLYFGVWVWGGSFARAGQWRGIVSWLVFWGGVIVMQLKLITELLAAPNLPVRGRWLMQPALTERKKQSTIDEMSTCLL